MTEDPSRPLGMPMETRVPPGAVPRWDDLPEDAREALLSYARGEATALDVLRALRNGYGDGCDGEVRERGARLAACLAPLVERLEKAARRELDALVLPLELPMRAGRIDDYKTRAIEVLTAKLAALAAKPRDQAGDRGGCGGYDSAYQRGYARGLVAPACQEHDQLVVGFRKDVVVAPVAPTPARSVYGGPWTSRADCRHLVAVLDPMTRDAGFATAWCCYHCGVVMLARARSRSRSSTTGQPFRGDDHFRPLPDPGPPRYEHAGLTGDAFLGRVGHADYYLQHIAASGRTIIVASTGTEVSLDAVGEVEHVRRRSTDAEHVAVAALALDYLTRTRCSATESGGARCELPRGHVGQHACPHALTRFATRFALSRGLRTGYKG